MTMAIIIFMLVSLGIAGIIPVLIVLLLRRKYHQTKRKPETGHAGPTPPGASAAGDFQRHYYAAQKRGRDIDAWDIPPEQTPWEK